MDFLASSVVPSPVARGIPKDAQDAVKSLLALDEKTKKKIIDRLKGMDLTMDPARFRAPIEEVVGDSKDTKSFESVFRNLYLIYDEGGSIEHVRKVIVAAGIGAELIDGASEWLEACLQTEAVCVLAKANRLLFEQGKVFQTARIVTDVRPIFHGNVRDGPKASLIFHNVSFHYHTLEHGYDAVQLAMDDEDLRTLAQLIDRALQKAEILESNSPVPVLREPA